MFARISSALAVLFAASLAGAQQPDFFHRPSPMAGAFMTSLATFPEVQKEAKLSADDSKKVEDLLGKMGEEMGAAFQDAGGDFGKLNVAISNIMTKTDAELLKGLTADQGKRVKELFVQFAGATVIVREDFAKDLGLSDDQKSKVNARQMDQGKKIGDLISSAGGDFASIAPDMKKLQDTYKTDLAAMLTDDQKKKLEDMKGAKFEFAKPAAGGGR